MFEYKMSRFLQFRCKLNTREIVKTCPFCFLCDYYGDSVDVMFSQFANHFLSFPMVFPYISPSVSTISYGVSTVSPRCFPRFLFQILCKLARTNGILSKLRYFVPKDICFSVYYSLFYTILFTVVWFGSILVKAILIV